MCRGALGVLDARDVAWFRVGSHHGQGDSPIDRDNTEQQFPLFPKLLLKRGPLHDLESVLDLMIESETRGKQFPNPSPFLLDSVKCL